MSIIDHLGLSYENYDAARAFFDAALAPLGISCLAEFEIPTGTIAGYGRDDKPEFWLHSGKPMGQVVHVAFTAQTRAEVDAFYAAALAAGGADNGAPGIRKIYHPNYYGAFVLDPDGHNIEAVCHAPE